MDHAWPRRRKRTAAPAARATDRFTGWYITAVARAVAGQLIPDLLITLSSARLLREWISYEHEEDNKNKEI